MQLFEFGAIQVEDLLSRLRAGHPVVLGSGRGDAALLSTLADHLGEASVLVQVTGQLDMAAYIPLVVAHQCDGGVLAQVSAALTDTSQPGVWQGTLDEALRGRFLLAGGTGALAPSATGWDLRGLVASETRTAREWLGQHAAITTRANVRVARPQPVTNTRWDAEALWQHAGRDPDRYALAVARELLQGPAEPALRGWDNLSLLQDLWQAMPSGFRDLMALLAVHGRPVLRSVFDRLGLVTPEVTDQACDLALIEQHHGQLALPLLWQEGLARLESGPHPGQRHRQLGEAFARLCGENPGTPIPLAVLEAHRHFAAIPDLPRAVEFARYGAGALLESAVAQSYAGRYADSARTYEALFELDGHVPREPRAGIGRGVRAYATHYQHYNRYLAREESVHATVAGYREALGDWPDNALFWSRLVRAQFVAQDETAALAALAEAQRVVPEHPERVRVLFVRTSDRLLQRGLVLPAAFVWWQHPSDRGVDASVGARLEATLAAGWTTKRLWVPGIPAMDLDPPRPLQVIACAPGLGFDCRAGDLTRHGSTVPEAVRAAVCAVVFDVLAVRWRRETGALAVASARFGHPAYQTILGIGPAIVPEILRLIDRTPDHWHQALATLTGANPVPAGARVTVAQVCAAWVVWGREQGMRW